MKLLLIQGGIIVNRKSLLILLSLIILIFSMIVGCEKETPQVIGEVNGEKNYSGTI